MNKIKYILYITGVLASYDGHSQPTKPNIIVINCDDMGYGDLSCFGSPTIKTPNIDRMAIEGQKWSSFYVSASVSSPCRIINRPPRSPYRNVWRSTQSPVS